MTNKRLSWIHLSDLHFGQKSLWLWPNFKSIFLKDLRRISDEAGPIDLVIFSGDLTQGGTEQEFRSLTSVLQEIWDVWNKQDPRPRFFLVPGNHDLVRPEKSDAALKMLTRWDQDPDVVKEFWAEKNGQYFGVVNKAFSNYLGWLDHLSAAGIPVAPIVRGLVPGDISSSLQINGLSVGLIGLNTAFLQLTDGNFEEKLILDPRQICAVTEDDPPLWCERHEINFLVTHHPPTWLTQAAQKDFHAEINPSGRFTAHLFGHMHEADLQTVSRGGDSGRKTYQSASLFGMEYLSDGSTKRSHGYAVGQIAFHDDQVSWKLWPRKGIVSRQSGDRKIIPDHENFTLVQGSEFQFEKLVRPTPSSRSVVATSPPAPDLSSTVEESAPKWNNALDSALYPLVEQDHHSSIRPLQQQACAEGIRQKAMVWVSADWGLGRDGFIWSVLKRIGREADPIYKIELGNYGTREEFLTSFATKAGCAFQEFCKALAAAGPAVVVFDEAPVTTGGSPGLNIENDVENLAAMVRDFCQDVVLFLLARTSPRKGDIQIVPLDQLDEADTRTYLKAHPLATSDLKTQQAVTEIFRRTDGLPGKIDSALKTLRVVSLSELGIGATVGHDALPPPQEAIPASLIGAVSALTNSPDPSSKRSYFLLKVLAVLPHGDSLQRLRRIEPQTPIYARNAEELFELDLIHVRASTTLIGTDGGSEERLKVLVASRPVRDYVLSLMTDREIDNLVRKAISLYFGQEWRSGRASLTKLSGALTTDDGSLLENPHTLVLRLLERAASAESLQPTSAELNLCQIYCSALLAGKHHRNCATACRDILALIPAIGYDAHRNSLEFLLARALRMSGEVAEARKLFEHILDLSWPTDIKAQLLVGYALCLQSLDDPNAIVVANQVIKLAPKSACAMQAESIVLEMEDDADNAGKLLQLENSARKLGFDTVANNLTLGRVPVDGDDDAGCEALRQVYSTAMTQGDSYTAARASTKLGNRLIKRDGNLSSDDLHHLISAYQYFYGERTGSLFRASHEALWQFFENQGDVRNLLSLFRHSSFIWRLHGNEANETKYAQRLIENARHVLDTDPLKADKNTAYFLVRARENSLPLIAPNVGQ